MKAVLYKLGRTLQLIGMILLPIAMAGNLAPDSPVSQQTMLALTGLGLLIFGLGWLLQQANRPG